MKRYKKAIGSALAAFLAVSGGLCGCDGTPQAEAPDYSASDKQFSFYAYAPPGDGIYTVDGVSYDGAHDENGNRISFQTVEKYREYAECGFDTIMFQADDPYTGTETWEESHLKSIMDKANEVGLRAIMFDSRLHDLSASVEPIVGTGCRFSTQEELEEYVASCMKDYTGHPAFYGLLIRDEPTYEMLPAIGSLYRAIKKNYPDCFIQCNLFPLDPSNAAAYAEGGTVSTANASYRAYLEEFIDRTGADYVMFDSYPMMKDTKGGNIIKEAHLKGLEIATDVARSKNVALYAVAQTCSWKKNGIQRARACTEADMYWQTNLYMGMGVKQISYFTYQRKRTNSTSGEYFDDGTSFIRSNGEKTELYDWMQKIHGEMQKLASVILNFDYVGLRSYVGGTAPCPIGFLAGVQDCEFTMIDDAQTSDSSVMLITELYDDEKNQYMYMIQNIADPSVVAESLTASVTFSDTQALAVYDKGERTLSEYDGEYTVELAPGEAVFVLPY